MGNLSLIDGYADPDLHAGEKAPPMGFKRMLELSLRTWPYMRPMLKHLVGLVLLIASFSLLGLPALFVGADLLTNKVLLGQKLQPLQATVLFVGDEYVTEDPDELGEAAGSKKQPAKSKGIGVKAAPLPDVAPELTPAQRRTVFHRLVIWGVIGGVFGTLLGSVYFYYQMWVWQCINQNLRVAMVGRAESLSLGYHDNARVGDAIFRVYQDSSMIVNLIQSGIIGPIYAFGALVFGLIVVAAFDPWFALIVVLFMVPVTWVAVLSTPRIRRRALANRVANSSLTSRVQEIFSASKVIKANGAERQVFARFNEDSRRALDAAYFLRLDMVLVSLVVAVLGGAVVILSEFIMVTWIIERRETFLGALVAALIGFVAWNLGAFQIARESVTGLTGGARGLAGTWMRMQDLFLALERAFFVLDLEPGVVDPENPQAYPSPINRVSWQGVDFSYNKQQPVLKGINLEAHVGTVTAVVGTTGSGKSTLMSLLLRLYDPDAGRVEVNGVDLRTLAVDEVRANTAIALQKNVLFADTVANNICFGTTGASRQDVEAAAAVACADSFVREMAKGYDTELGERGGKLSAGQRQRLSIARAVVRNTPILILDEPTASLDARTEQDVLRNLAAWGQDRVIFLVTHRLSTIRNADQIAFIDAGAVVEKGTHDELMSHADGHYRAFVEAESVVHSS